MTGVEVAPALDEKAARTLTDRIHGAIGSAWELATEAFEGQAWKALGYKSWGAYTEAEFGASSAGIWRLLTQGQVTRQLEEAAGLPQDPGRQPLVSGREAVALKGVIDTVAEEVRTAIKGTRRTTRPGVVRDVVKEALAEKASEAASRARDDKTQPPQGLPDRRFTTAPSQPAAKPVEKASVPKVTKAEKAAGSKAWKAAQVLVAVPPLVAAAGLEGDRAARLVDSLRRWCRQVEAGQRPVAPAVVGECKHPVNRRMGKMCAVCGKTLEKAS